MSRDKSPPLNVIVSSGDHLENVKFAVLSCVRQDLQVEEPDFKRSLLDRGLGYAFYGPYLYLTSLDGQEITADKLSDALIGQVRKSTFTFREETVPNFSDDSLWFGIAVPIIRDALKITLKAKIKNNKDLLLRDLAVFNKKAEATCYITANVLYGVSLKDFVRVDTVGLGLCPIGRLEVFDTERRNVEDYSLRNRLLTKSYLQYDKLHGQYFGRTMASILPFTLHFGNKTLTFEQRFLEIHATEKLTSQASSSVEERLDKWF